ncbi:unnamed protein product [Leuciscus chuanchicus]
MPLPKCTAHEGDAGEGISMCHSQHRMLSGETQRTSSAEGLTDLENKLKCALTATQMCEISTEFVLDRFLFRWANSQSTNQYSYDDICLFYKAPSSAPNSKSGYGGKVRCRVAAPALLMQRVPIDLLYTERASPHKPPFVRSYGNVRSPDV